MPLIGISLDDGDVLREYREREGMPFPLLSDVAKEAGNAFGVLLLRSRARIRPESLSRFSHTSTK